MRLATLSKVTILINANEDCIMSNFLGFTFPMALVIALIIFSWLSFFSVIFL